VLPRHLHAKFAHDPDRHHLIQHCQRVVTKIIRYIEQFYHTGGHSTKSQHIRRTRKKQRCSSIASGYTHATTRTTEYRGLARSCRNRGARYQQGNRPTACVMTARPTRPRQPLHLSIQRSSAPSSNVNCIQNRSLVCCTWWAAVRTVMNIGH